MCSALNKGIFIVRVSCPYHIVSRSVRFIRFEALRVITSKKVSADFSSNSDCCTPFANVIHTSYNSEVRLVFNFYYVKLHNDSRNVVDVGKVPFSRL